MEGEKRIIIIEIGSLGPLEVLLTGESPSTADTVWRGLPATSRANLWGDEVYFELPLEHPPEGGRAEVDVGDVAWWPAGNCLCLFFGPTPASPRERPVAASPVNVIGRIRGDPRVLSSVKDADPIALARG